MLNSLINKFKKLKNNIINFFADFLELQTIFALMQIL